MARKPAQNYLGMPQADGPDMPDFSLGGDPNDTLSMQAQDPTLANTAVSMVPGARATVPTKGKRTQKTTTTDNKMSTTKNLYAAPDEFLDRANTIEQLPHIQGMEKGISNMEDQLSMIKNQKPANDYFVNPLMALADSETGSKLSGTYKQGPTARDIQSTLLAGQGKIQDQRNDMSKAIFDGVAKLKDGSTTNALNTRMMDMMMNQSGMANSMDARMNLQDERQAFRAHQATVNAIRTNPDLTKSVGQYRNLSNALAVIANADKVTPQQLHEAQQAIRSNIGIKGASTGGEREDTYYTSLGLNAANWKQFLTGKPEDIRNNKEMLDHIKQLALLERANVEAQSQQKLDVLSGGNDWMYDDPKFAHYKASRDHLIEAAGKQFKPIDRTGVKAKVDAQMKEMDQPMKKTAPAAPPVGTVEVDDQGKKHAYMGGNPGDPAAWKEVE